MRAHFCGENKVYSFGGTGRGQRRQSTGPLGAATTSASVASNSIGATTATGKLEGPVGECEEGDEGDRRRGRKLD